MPVTPARATRRRTRRGSLERPVNARLYRNAFAVLAVPLLLLAFSSTRIGPLAAPLLPPNFDGAATSALAASFATTFPDRTPGSARALGAAQWVASEFAAYGLPVHTQAWSQHVPGLGRVRLENVWAVAPGQSRSAILVLAHRDDTGAGTGANDDASGTAALIELARSYAEEVTAPGGTGTRPVRSAHTIVFLSTDGGSYGNLGAARFAARPPYPIVGAINLVALGGRGAPRLVIAGDTPRSPAAALVATAAARVREQTGMRPRRTSLGGQLLDLAFPLTFYDQGPLLAHGIPAVTLTSAGQAPPMTTTGEQPARLDTARLTGLGRAAQEIVGSLDEGLALAPGSTSFLWTGGRIVRGWAIELLLAAGLVPFGVAAVDLFARCLRRRVPLRAAVRALRTRVTFWIFAGVAFYAFTWLGAWPGTAGRPANPTPAAAGHYPTLTLLALGVVLLLGWLLARAPLVPRRPVGDDEALAGDTAALLALGVVALLVLATNAYALIFVLPALHAWIWLPQVRRRPLGMRVAVLLAGLAGPALLLASLALRLDLGREAPWYALQLAAAGHVGVVTVVTILAAGACGAQLAAGALGRYAPYPARGERPSLGPLRRTVRALVLADRARRRRARYKAR